MASRSTQIAARRCAPCTRARCVFSDYLSGRGYLVIVDHGNGYWSLYGHNQELFKAKGAGWRQAKRSRPSAIRAVASGPACISRSARHSETRDPRGWFRSPARRRRVEYCNPFAGAGFCQLDHYSYAVNKSFCGHVQDLATDCDFSPYAQLVAALLPRAAGITVFEPNGELRWTSEESIGPAALKLVQASAAAAALSAEAGERVQTAQRDPLYLFWLRDEAQAADRHPLGQLAQRRERAAHLRLCACHAAAGAGVSAP